MGLHSTRCSQKSECVFLQDEDLEAVIQAVAEVSA